MAKFFLTTILVVFAVINVSGQVFHTNKPKLVYPVLEEFVVENYKRGNFVLERLHQIDTIIVEDLGYDIEGEFIRKIYGLAERTGSRYVLRVDSSLISSPKRFERTLKHELGHVFGLAHLNEHKDRFEFMSQRHLPEVKLYYDDPVIWAQVNDRYYESLKNKK